MQSSLDKEEYRLEASLDNNNWTHLKTLPISFMAQDMIEGYANKWRFFRTVSTVTNEVLMKVHNASYPARSR